MFIDSAISGMLPLPWWGYILVALALTHITIISVTIYLHRHQAHRALEMSPVLSHFFRLWLWLTTGMTTRGWVAVHRKHHDTVETNDDPHSPRIYGINKVLWEGTELYRKEAACKETLAKYGQGTPNDWIERNIYSHNLVGIFTVLAVLVLLFGAAGISIWAVQMMWIPFFAAGVINGLGHWFGYRNFQCHDNSTNIIPWGILIGGEELHNNHHAFANSARLSYRWWEFDVGWMYLQIFRVLGLVKINKVSRRPPVTRLGDTTNMLDIDTLRTILTNKQYIMARYCKDVVRRVCREELQSSPDMTRARLLSYAHRFAMHHRDIVNTKIKEILDTAWDDPSLSVIYRQKARLQDLWQQRSATAGDMESSLRYLSEWCHEAEKSGVDALKEFAMTLRRYTSSPVLSGT